MGSSISLTASDGFQLSAYRAEPEGPARGGVVVVQEIFGVNGHIRSVADRYAAAGYLAIAPAIFDRDRPGIELGYTPRRHRGGSRHRDGLSSTSTTSSPTSPPRGVAAREAGKVGIVGYCFGGRITAAAAIQLPDVFDAASSYYGGGVVGLIDQTPVVPMIMHFGEQDHAIPMEDVAQGRGGVARRHRQRLRRRSTASTATSGHRSAPFPPPSPRPARSASSTRRSAESGRLTISSSLPSGSATRQRSSDSSRSRPPAATVVARRVPRGPMAPRARSGCGCAADAAPCPTHRALGTPAPGSASGDHGCR